VSGDGKTGRGLEEDGQAGDGRKGDVQKGNPSRDASKTGPAGEVEAGSADWRAEWDRASKAARAEAERGVLSDALSEQAAGAAAPQARGEAAYAALVSAKETLAGLKGWRRALLGISAGALGCLAMAPVGFWPALIPAFCLLLIMLDGRAGLSGAKRWRAGAWDGWLFGFGYFLVGLYWIVSPFLVDAQAFAWMAPFAVVLLPAGLALFTALAGALAMAFWPRSDADGRVSGMARLLVLAASFAAAEWVRGHVFTGFAWNLTAQAWAGQVFVLQSAALLGSYGLGLVTVLIAAAPALLLDGKARPKTPGDARNALERAAPDPAPIHFGHRVRMSVWLPCLLAAVALAAMAGLGAWRVSALTPVVDPTRSEGQGVIRIVQPNTYQRDRLDPAKRQAIWNQLINVTRQPGIAAVTHVLWPEAAPPVVIDQWAEGRRAIAEILPPQAYLITGAIRVVPGENGETQYFNALHAINANAAVVATYDKHHLVPFGEYIPFREILEPLGLRKIAQGAGLLTPGEGPRTLTLPGSPAVGPLICYEVIFPGQVTDPRARPAFLVNVTDDSWFGNTSGPRQHLAMARLRAVEEGLPLARSASTGISALIDPLGRVVARLEWNSVGFLDHEIPQALPATAYARWGDSIFLLVLLATGLGAALMIRLRV